MTHTTLLPSRDVLQPGAAPPVAPSPRLTRRRDTGLYLERSPGIAFAETRSFDATQGQWLQEDAVGFAGSAANLHRYVTNLGAMPER
jgi:hypothetical protein